MANPWTKQVQQAITGGHLEEVVAKLENAALQRQRIDAALWERIPDEAVEASPLLIQARCEEWIRRGELLPARESLSAVLGRLAARTLRGPLLSALSQLAVINLRIGQLQEAEPILRFLRDEWENAEEEVGGDVAYALARGIALLDDDRAGRDSGHYYNCAMEAFDRDGETDKSAFALFDMLARRAMRMPPEEWEERLLAFKRRMSVGHIGAGYYAYLCACRAFGQGKAEQALRDLAGVEAGSFASPYPMLMEIVRMRAAMRSGQSEPGKREAGFVDSAGFENAVDLDVQFAWACARFEMAAAGPDWERAGSIRAQARSLSRMGLLAEADVHLGIMDDCLEKRMVPAIALRSGAVSAVPSWKARLFGRFCFACGEREMASIRWKRSKTKELMLYLLLQPDFTVSREKATEALFPEGEPDKNANQFYVAAHQLKQIIREYLGVEGGVVVKDGMVKLKDGLIEEVDAEQYTTLMRIADQLWATDRGLAVPLYEKALPLYGELAPDVPYVDWLERSRERMLRQQCETLGKLARVAAEKSSPHLAEAYGREWTRLAPLQEEAYQALLEALTLQGKRAEAIALYHRIETLFREELGTGPMPETRSIVWR